MERIFDGTKESAAAASERARMHAMDALSRVSDAIADLQQAEEVILDEERRHKAPAPNAQRQAVMWQGLVGVLENVAECLGAPGSPHRSVTWNGEDFEVEYHEPPKVTSIERMF